MGFRYGDSGMGHWNLDLAGVDPLLSLYESGGRAVAVDLPRFDSPEGAGTASVAAYRCGRSADIW